MPHIREMKITLLFSYSLAILVSLSQAKPTERLEVDLLKSSFVDEQSNEALLQDMEDSTGVAAVQLVGFLVRNAGHLACKLINSERRVLEQSINNCLKVEIARAMENVNGTGSENNSDHPQQYDDNQYQQHDNKPYPHNLPNLPRHYPHSLPHHHHKHHHWRIWHKIKNFFKKHGHVFVKIGRAVCKVAGDLTCKQQQTLT